MNQRQFSIKPTPYVGEPEAARWVTLTYNQALSLKNQLAEEAEFWRTGKIKPGDHFPLTESQCLQVAQHLTSQIPADLVVTPDTELEFRLLESEIYQINSWRVYVEGLLADAMHRTPVHTIGGYYNAAKIMAIYGAMTRLKMRLATA